MSLDDDYFLKTSFVFSENAKDWILSHYEDKFKKNFYHDLDITNFQSQLEWYKSIAGKELIEFLHSCNCSISYYGINSFISNHTEDYIGNPHVDTKFANSRSYRIQTRFNVMVLGNPADEMVWWKDIEYGDQRLIDHRFRTLSGTEYISKAIPGNTVEERWEYMGEPTLRASNLLTPAAFVRTDCVHTVSVSPGPRLIVTVAIDKPIKKITDVIR